MRHWIRRIKRQAVFFGGIVTADQWRGQAFIRIDIVKPVAAFNTKTAFIGWPITAINRDDFIVLNRISQLTANPAIRANTIDCPIRGDGQVLIFIKHSFRHQRPCWAGLDTFPATHTGALSHIIPQIKDDMRISTTASKTNHVIDLNFTAGTDAKVTLNASIHIHRNGRVRGIRFRLFTAWQA